ncbi:MAG: choice-of-anchor L domain-containing protein [Chitinophagales bacterium]
MKHFLPLFLILFLLTNQQAYAQGIGTAPNGNYTYLVEDVFVTGNCLTVSNIIGCGSSSIGTFSNGGSIGLGGNNGVGIILASGPVSNAIGPNNSQSTSGPAGCGANALLPGNTTEGAYLQFDFIPVEGFIQFNYIFASEEYGGDYDCSVFNDVFGFFLSGPNPAGGTYNNQNLAVIGGQPVTINNFNDQGCGDPGPYTNNVGGTVMQYDGWVSGSVYAEVDTCETYTITIAVADVGDSVWDSAVFLEGKSFSTGTAATVAATVGGEELEQVYEGCQEIVFSFCKDLTVNDENEDVYVSTIVSGSATNGIDYGFLPPEILIPAGSTCIEWLAPVFDDGIDDPGEFIEIEITNNTCPCNANPPPVIINIIENDLEVSVNDVEICPGGVPQLLTAQVSGGIPDYIITWYLNGVPTQPVVFASNPGTVYNYTVQVQDACENTVTAPVVVTVGGAPPPLVIGGPDLLCPPGAPGYNPEAVLFANIDLGIWSGPGIVDERYGIFNIDTAFAELPQFPVAGQPYIYTITYTTEDACGQTQVGTYDVLIESEPVVEIFDPGPVCINKTATLQTLVNYSFDLPEGSSSFWGYVTPNLYLDQFTGEVSGFQGSPPYQVYFQYTTPTGCHTVRDTISLDIVPVPTATLGNDTILLCPTPGYCDDIPIKLTGSAPWALTIFNDTTDLGGIFVQQNQTTPIAGTDTVVYMLSVCEEGIYEVSSVVDNNGCEGDISGNSTVEVAPPLTAILPDTSICYVGEPIVLNIALTGVPPFFVNASYTGSNNNVPLIQSVNDTIYTITLSPVMLNGNIPGTVQINSLSSNTLNCPATFSGVATIGTFTITDATPNNETCTDANGSITEVETQGLGTNNVGYIWTNAAGDTISTNPNLTDISAGDYTVFVENAFGCKDDETYNIVDEEGPVIDGATVTGSVCNLPNGSITNLTLSTSGTGNLSYTWTNGGGNVGSSADLLNQMPGDYTVTVSDENACTNTMTFTISGAAPPVILDTTPINAHCGQDDGSITNINVQTETGESIVSYQWTDTQGNTWDSEELNGISSDTYTLIVTDSNGCTDTLDVAIVDLPGPQLAGGETGIETCLLNDGSVTGITITQEGTLPYTFAWTNAGNNPVGGNNIDLTNVPAGNYTLTITDAAGCNDVIGPFDITKAPDPSIGGGTENNETCTDSNGSITGVSVSGGTGNYTYAWSNNSAPNTVIGSQADLTNIPAGSYTLLVTDEANCTATQSYTIVNEAGPTLSGGEPTPAVCSEPNGAINGVSISGGTAPITIAWTNSSNQNVGSTLNLSNIPPDIYTLIITDANDCTDNTSIEVTTLPLPTLSGGTVSNETCSNGNGSITGITATGEGTLSYTWVNTGNTSTVGSSIDLSNQPAGNYTLTLTDGNGCTTTLDFTIDDEAAPEIVGGTTSPSSCGQADGSISGISVNGGTGTITYAWTNNQNQSVGTNSPNLNFVIAGAYTLTITDQNGCTDEQTYSISDVGAPIIDLSQMQITHTTCSENNGAISGITASGGTGGLSFSWENNSVEIGTTLNINNLYAGTYVLTVSDNSGCSASETIIINDSPGPTLANGLAQNASSCLEDGSITGVSVNGGTPNVNFAWYDDTNNPIAGGNSLSLNNIAGGDYTIIATDANNCKDTLNFTVGTDLAPSLTGGNVQNTTCSQANGSVTGIVAGGVTPYTYNWVNDNNPAVSVSTAINLTNVPAGNYTLTLTDGNNCSTTAPFTITDQPAPQISGGTPNQSSCGQSDGSIVDVSITGNSTPITYVWTNAQTTNVGQGTVNGLVSLNNIPSGAYTLSITDANGCTDTQNFSVSDASAPAISGGNIIETTCSVANGGVNGINVSGGDGNYSYSWTSNGSEVSTNQQLSNVAAGTYVLTVTDGAGCQDSETFTITDNPSPILVGGTATPPSCGQNNGSVTGITIQNGTGTSPFTYTWTDENGFVVGGNNINLTNVGQGTYTLTVTDNNNCTDSASFDVINLSIPVIVVDNITVSECGIGTGTASVTVTGGVQPYTFSWTNSSNQVVSTNEDATGLLPGLYTFAVTDDTDCTLTEPVLVPGNIPPPTPQCGDITYNSLTFTWNDIPGATAYLVSYQSLGDTLQVDASTLSYTLNNLSPNQTISFFVATIGEEGCGSSSFTSVNCTTEGCPDVPISLSGLDNAYCMSDLPVTMSVSPTGVTVSGAGVNGLIFDPAMAGAGTHTLSLHYEVEYPLSTCEYDGTVQVSVFPDPIAEFDMSGVSTCVGDLVDITFTGFANPGDILTWNFGEGATPATGTGTGPFSVLWNESGNKDVSLSIGSAYCSDMLIQQIPVSAVDIAAIQDTEIVLGQSIELYTEANSALGGNLTYTWVSNGDDLGFFCETCPSPTATPQDSTVYQVIVEDEYGCTSSETIIIDVYITPYIYIPTAFSPNGDGLNDYFRVLSREITSMDFFVYDRWGELLYETHEVSHQGWDGTMKGVPGPLEVYVYYCHYIDNRGKEEVLKGNVTLVR